MSKPESTGLPLDLSRSLLVIIIPGAVATTAWGLLLCFQYPSVIAFYGSHEVTGNIVLFVVAVLCASVIENFGTNIEVKWYRQRRTHFDVTENWYNYSATVTQHEPV